MRRSGNTNGNQKFDDLPDWVKPRDAARYLNISRSNLYELLQTKTIPSRRLGRCIRIPKAALAARVEELVSA